jgi:hypothetical protein
MKNIQESGTPCISFTGRPRVHDAENTIRANKKCANILREYLKENKQNSEFETFDRVRLNETLSHFYVDIRKPNGQKYKARFVKFFPITFVNCWIMNDISQSKSFHFS